MLKSSSLFLPRWKYRQLRVLAEKLRKNGCSYQEIRRSVPVSKSTISNWCKDIPLTKVQIARLGSLYDFQLKGAKANQAKSAERKRQVFLAARDEISKPNLTMLKIAGAMLYWAEGDKQSGVSITNSDPTFVIFYIKWLKKVFKISPTNLSAFLHLHQGQNNDKEKLFWSKLSGIPIENFNKTFYKPVGTGHRKNILYHGTIRVRVKGKGMELLRHRILGWAEAVAKHLVPQNVIKIHYRGRTGR